MFARRVHALPESLVATRREVAVGHDFVDRRGFEKTVFPVEVAREEGAIDDHESAIDEAAGPGRFFLKSRYQIAIEFQFAEAPLRMDGGNRQQLAGSAVKIEQRGDIDVRHAVAVGQKEFAVFGGEIARGAPHPAAGHGFDAGVGQRHLPVGFEGFAVIDDAALLAQLHGDVGRAGVKIEEIVDELLALVAEAENEAGDAECGVSAHDVPDDRLFADRHHRFREQLGHFPQPGPLPAAENHRRGHRPFFIGHGRILSCNAYSFRFG